MGGWEGIGGSLVEGSGSGESFWPVGRLVVQCGKIVESGCGWGCAANS